MTAQNDPHQAATAPVVLASQVEYQPDAIVSRVLARSKGGNVTLFAFDAGQELGEHTAPFDALVYAIDGTAEIGVGEETYSMSAGELLRLPAKVPHWVKATRPFKMLLIMLRDPGAAE